MNAVMYAGTVLGLFTETPAPETATGALLTTIERVIENLALVIELLAVAIIVVGTILATVTYARLLLGGEAGQLGYERYKVRMGRALLLGLEILVAADIVRTVALEPSLTNIAILGILVLIRTFLSWSLVVEIEHRWPWKIPSAAHDGAAAPDEEIGRAPDA